MAEEFFRGKEPYPAGIPLALRRAFHRSAEGDPARREERFLIFVQKGENFLLSYAASKTLPATYPHAAALLPSHGDNRISFPRDGWLLAGKWMFFMGQALRTLQVIHISGSSK